jgi:glycosyltransferase involved in cell wall biosynthesis
MTHQMPRFEEAAVRKALHEVLNPAPTQPGQSRSSQRLALIAQSASELITWHARLIREACTRGHEVFCFAPRDGEGFRALSALGVEPVALPGVGPGREKHAVRELALALHSLSPDVVVAVSWPVARTGLAAAARAEVARIVAAFPELALALDPGRGAENARMRRECAALLSRCHAAIVPGLERDPVVRGRSIIPPDLDVAFIAGPGVDLARVGHVPLAPLTKGMVFLAIAYPGSEPGIAVYCESARRLSEKGGNAIYLTVSPPGEAPSPALIALMQSHRGVVRYLGPREEMDRLLARAHAVVFAGEEPCLPREIGHALAIGRPVIAADMAARGRAVRDGVNGRRVPAGDADALSGAMSDLLRRPDLIPGYAKASRAIANAEFDLDAAVARVLATLGL